MGQEEKEEEQEQVNVAIKGGFLSLKKNFNIGEVPVGFEVTLETFEMSYASIAGLGLHLMKQMEKGDTPATSIPAPTNGKAISAPGVL